MSVSDEVLDQARMQQMEQREQEVDSMIRSNRYASAVQTALSNPPLGTKNKDIKTRNSAIVARALNAVPEKDAEIKKVVDSLEPELEDHLMKYIYRILGEASSCGAMLKWHKVLMAKSGLGCIVRAITDRKSV